MALSRSQAVAAPEAESGRGRKTKVRGPALEPKAKLALGIKGFRVQGLGFRVQGLGFKVPRTESQKKRPQALKETTGGEFRV